MAITKEELQRCRPFVAYFNEAQSETIFRFGLRDNLGNASPVAILAGMRGFKIDDTDWWNLPAYDSKGPRHILAWATFDWAWWLRERGFPEGIHSALMQGRRYDVLDAIDLELSRDEAPQA